MATIEELKQKAVKIKTETEVGGNTAERVGQILEDIVDKIGDKNVGSTYNLATSGAKYTSILNAANAVPVSDRMLGMHLIYLDAAGVTQEVVYKGSTVGTEWSTDDSLWKTCNGKGGSNVDEAIAESFQIFGATAFKGWKLGIVEDIKVGNKYRLTYTVASGNALLTLYSEDTAGTRTTIFINKSVSGTGTLDVSPSVEGVKWDLYSSVAVDIDLSKINTERSVILKSDVVNSLQTGGVEKPLSAEQGKVLNGKFSSYDDTLFSQPINLQVGAVVNGRVYANSRRTFTVVPNTNIDRITVKDGYYFEFIGESDTAVSGAAITTIVKNTDADYYNSATKKYLWVSVWKDDGSEFCNTDLQNTVHIIGKEENTYSRLLEVDDLYRLGVTTEIKATTNDGTIGEPQIDGTINSTGYPNSKTSDYVSVVGMYAILFYGADWRKKYANQNGGSRVIHWYDGEKKLIGATFATTDWDTNVLRFLVPKGAVYARWAVKNEYKIEGITLKSVLERIYALGEAKSPIGHLKKVTFILTNGQSLSIGSGAPNPFDTTPIYDQLLMFNKTKRTDDTNIFRSLRNNVRLNDADVNNGTNPQVGMGNAFVEFIAKENGLSATSYEWEDHLLLFVSCGIGGILIEDLLNDTNYAYVTGSISQCKMMCDKFGWEFNMPAWVWMQGEQNIKSQMSTADYKAKLLEMHNKVCASITSITGQAERPKCIIYQPSCQNIYTMDYGFNNPYMAVPTAFWELLRDNDEFLASVPTYIFDPCKIEVLGAWVHCDETSYVLLGAYNGYTIKKFLIDGVSQKGVIATDITVDGNTIKIKYNVPCGPLRFDTEYVNAAPNMGFNVVKSDNSELITKVSVFKDTVTIECSESPIGAKLRYGLNGNKVAIKNNPYTTGFGRENGGRGNLRDSQGNFIYHEIQGKKYPMYNWAFAFEKVL